VYLVGDMMTRFAADELDKIGFDMEYGTNIVVGVGYWWCAEGVTQRQWWEIYSSF
jgi:hypothetical protein